uniref:Uncharacterized protein n=1 Tax=Solibacter usitatus (strain Ellin6076) TaxID=234267 RepID=Q020H0_SOLUE
MSARKLKIVLPLLCAAALGAAEPAVIRTGFHLTARPWKPLNIERQNYLEVIEGLCRFSVRYQDASGAIIDPFLKREHQYATPYFAYAVGTLVEAGRARDLLPYGVKAMEHSTANFAGGRDAIPDQHGEFFIPALTEALEVYEKQVPAETLNRWRDRLKKPWREIVRGSLNNWETYKLKGEWLRAAHGLASREDAIATIEDSWKVRQRDHFTGDPWWLYHDRSSEPDTLSVEAVGRDNLLALVHLGYNGPSAQEMRNAVEKGTAFTLLLQDPTGQVPANGRTDDHVWVDVGYQLAFEVMAERAWERGDRELAGEFRHAALMAFANIARWRRTDPPWDGSYYITKNHFDPALRVGYQTATEYSNYSGSLMFHLAEAFHIRSAAIPERPAPSEVGGYAIATDSSYDSVFANAGGMYVQANLRGQEGESSGNYWTPLGVVRFARPGWDSRLGPSDGAQTKSGGVTFAPEFLEQGRWLRMGDLSARYRGVWTTQFVHPLLVRCAIEYRPLPGMTGPTFRNEFTVTPDGVLSVVTKTSRDESAWAITWPILENDGAALERSHAEGIQSVRYPGSGDEQNFLALGAATFEEGAVMRSTYGDLRPVRVRGESATFVYPRSAADPPAASVRQSLAIHGGDFSSVLGRVIGNTYSGRTSAGGQGRSIDIDGDGKADVTFDVECGFVLQLRQSVVVAAEADRDVTASIRGKRVLLKKYQPVTLGGR